MSPAPSDPSVLIQSLLRLIEFLLGFSALSVFLALVLSIVILQYLETGMRSRINFFIVREIDPWFAEYIRRNAPQLLQLKSRYFCAQLDRPHSRTDSGLFSELERAALRWKSSLTDANSAHSASMYIGRPHDMDEIFMEKFNREMSEKSVKSFFKRVSFRLIRASASLSRIGGILSSPLRGASAYRVKWYYALGRYSSEPVSDYAFQEKIIVSGYLHKSVIAILDAGRRSTYPTELYESLTFGASPSAYSRDPGYVDKSESDIVEKITSDYIDKIQILMLMNYQRELHLVATYAVNRAAILLTFIAASGYYMYFYFSFMISYFGDLFSPRNDIFLHRIAAGIDLSIVTQIISFGLQATAMLIVVLASIRLSALVSSFLIRIMEDYLIKK